MFLISYSSLLMAVGFTGSALAITLFVIWFTARSENFLLTWSVGALLVVAGAVTWGLYVERYNTLTLAASSYLVLSYGLALFYGSAWQLRHRRAPWRPVLCLSILTTLFISIPFATGYSGVGAFIANLVMATLLGITARECWLHRHEAPTPLAVLTLFYSAVAVTFLLCAGFIITTVPAQLDQAPQNWAEDLNALVLLIAITGIGATTLALNQSRLALHHRTIALTDVLTGLGNRRRLLDKYGASPLPVGTSVVVFDLDHFKAVNDIHGHAVGDQVLQVFTNVLQTAKRPSDLAARLGGEEFVLVLPNCPARYAEEVSERIRMRFEEQLIATPTGSLQCSVSAGIAVVNEAAEDLDVVMRKADIALYSAKREGGRNCVRLYDNLPQRGAA